MKKEEVKILEIGLINACPLKCPMCTRQDEEVSQLSKDILPLDKIKEVIEYFPNLVTIDLVGTISEPTLYPDFLELVSYIKSRNIKIFISSNANSRNKIFWTELGLLLDKDDVIKFAVDGSTQEIYEKYRVDGNLQKVLNNHTYFKNNNNLSILQFILFEHNKDDIENIKELFIKNNFDLLEILPCGEPADHLTFIRPIKEMDKQYSLKNKVNKSIKNHKIDCIAEEDFSLYLGCFGVLSACCDQDEETFFDKEIPNVFEDSIDEMMEHVNCSLDDKYETRCCIENCSKLSHTVYDKFPVSQYNRDLKQTFLTNFREVIRD